MLGLDAQRDSVEIHSRIGYLPGELELYPRMTGQQHIDWFARARGERDLSRARELVERFEVVLDRPAKQLSKGNRQKLGLVLAFMHRPELLILDEPTSGLDPLMQNEFERLVRETWREDGRCSCRPTISTRCSVWRTASAIIRAGMLVATDSVEHLRQSAPRRLEARFRSPVDRALFAGLAGVTVTEHEGDRGSPFRSPARSGRCSR